MEAEEVVVMVVVVVVVVAVVIVGGGWLVGTLELGVKNIRIRCHLKGKTLESSKTSAIK